MLVAIEVAMLALPVHAGPHVPQAELHPLRAIPGIGLEDARDVDRPSRREGPPGPHSDGRETPGCAPLGWSIRRLPHGPRTCRDAAGTVRGRHTRSPRGYSGPIPCRHRARPG